MISFVSASKISFAFLSSYRLLFWYLLFKFRYRWAHHLCFLSMNDLSRSSFFDLSIYLSVAKCRSWAGRFFRNGEQNPNSSSFKMVHIQFMIHFWQWMVMQSFVLVKIQNMIYVQNTWQTSSVGTDQWQDCCKNWHLWYLCANSLFSSLYQVTPQVTVQSKKWCKQIPASLSSTRSYRRLLKKMLEINYDCYVSLEMWLVP